MESKLIDIKRGSKAPAKFGGEWLDFRHEIENLFDRFARGFAPLSWESFGNIERLWPRADGFIATAVDVAEDDKTYSISVELPGLDEKNVTVSVKGNLLVIEGEKQQEKEEKAKGRYLSERSYGAFKRCFTLPSDADAENVKATFVKGVLSVTLPKTAAAQNVRKIDVKAA